MTQSLCRMLALAALIGCGARPAPPAPERDSPAHAWPMFRGTPDHRGDFADRRTPAWRVRWTAELGERIDASPLVTGDGRVLVVTRGGQLVALDAATGQRRGHARLSAGVWATPALAGGVVVAATEDGHLVGRSAANLRQRWRQRAPARSFSAITVARGQLYVCSGSWLLALAPASGRVQWKVELGGKSFTAPAVDLASRTIVVGTRAGDVLAFDLTGRPRWVAQTTPGAHNDGSPVIAGDTVLIGSNDQAVHAFALTDGARRWQTRGEAWVVSTPAVTGDQLFVGDDDGVLRALSVATGGETWRARVGDDLASSPTLVGELIVHGAHDGKLHAHRRDGNALPPIDAGAPLYASPAVATDGAIFFATHAGRVIAVE